jgi:hypothetical protein
MSELSNCTGSEQEIDWATLLACIEEGLVVPVIGPDLIRVQEDGESLSTEQWLVRGLAKLGHLGKVDTMPSTLNEAVWRILVGKDTRKKNEQQIGGILANIIKGLPVVPPVAFEQLAMITPLKLFVTTNMDSLLESAIDSKRYNGVNHTQSIFYKPKGPSFQNDLEAAEIPRGRTSVFHLFGRFGVARDGVLTEHDLIEYLVAMHTNERPKKLLHVLSKSYLLFIGCGHIDWLERFFLRSTKQTDLVDSVFGMEMISDSRTPREPSLLDFLSRIETPEIQVDVRGDPSLFVDELWNRWQKEHSILQQPYIPPAPTMPQHAVFISYMREDIDAVKNLKTGLDAAGIVSWFDKERLTVGDWFTPAIREAIARSQCVIAVISEHTGVEKSYFISEWRFALEQSKHWGRKFILPVVVSPNGISTSYIPLDIRAEFKQADIDYVPNGETSTNPGFVQAVKDLLFKLT